MHLSNDLTFVGDVEEARTILTQALEIRVALDGPNHPETAKTLANFCSFELVESRLVEAEVYCRQALDLLVAAYGAEHHNSALATMMLGKVLKAQGKAEVALPILRRSVERLDATLGEHPQTGIALLALADSLKLDGAYDEAEALYRRAQAMMRKTAPDSYYFVGSLINGGNFLWSAGRKAEAGPMYAEGLELAERVYGDKHPLVAMALINVGNYARHEERLADARAAYERALDIAKATYGDDHPELAHAYCVLGALDKDEGEYVAAYTKFARALQLWEAGAGPDNPELACALTHWGEALVEQRLYAEARPILERVVDLSRHQRINPWLYVDARLALADVLWTRKADRPRAVALVRDARAYCDGEPSLTDKISKLDAWLAAKVGRRDISRRAATGVAAATPAPQP